MTGIRTFRNAIVVALLSSLPMTPAMAQGKSDDTLPKIDQIYQMIMGNWSFQTVRYRGGSCEMSGSFSVYQPTQGNPDSLDCTVMAVEVCAGLRSRVEQSCKVSVSDNTLRIDSTIVSILETKGFSSGYAPDNFSLSKVSTDTMSGLLDSAVVAPVVFKRDMGGIS